MSSCFHSRHALDKTADERFYHRLHCVIEKMKAFNYLLVKAHNEYSFSSWVLWITIHLQKYISVCVQEFMKLQIYA